MELRWLGNARRQLSARAERVAHHCALSLRFSLPEWLPILPHNAGVAGQRHRQVFRMPSWSPNSVPPRHGGHTSQTLTPKAFAGDKEIYQQKSGDHRRRRSGPASAGASGRPTIQPGPSHITVAGFSRRGLPERSRWRYARLQTRWQGAGQSTSSERHRGSSKLYNTMWKTDDVAKWLGIVSGVVTLLLAVPAALGLGWWTRAVLGGALLGAVSAVLLYLKSAPYDLEFLDHRIELDLQDVNAGRVFQTRKTRIRALRNGVETVTDHMSADGGMSIPKVKPGVLKQINREGGDLYVESTFGHVLRKGEEVDREMTTTLENSFPDNQHEYWNVRIDHPTRIFTLSIKFSIAKPPKNFRGVQRTSTYEAVTPIQPQMTYSEGRATLVWSVPSPALRDLYKLDWNW